jgi:hypothetical protein
MFQTSAHRGAPDNGLLSGETLRRPGAVALRLPGRPSGRLSRRTACRVIGTSGASERPAQRAPRRSRRESEARPRQEPSGLMPGVQTGSAGGRASPIPPQVRTARPRNRDRTPSSHVPALGVLFWLPRSARDSKRRSRLVRKSSPVAVVADGCDQRTEGQQQEEDRPTNPGVARPDMGTDRADEVHDEANRGRLAQ